MSKSFLLIFHVLEGWLLPDDSSELSPGNDISNHAGHSQNIRIFLIYFKDNRAIAAEALQKNDIKAKSTAKETATPDPSLPPASMSSC